MSGISSKFLWYIFKPYFYVLGIIISLNLIITAIFSQPFMLTLISDEYKLGAIGLLNLGLCYTGVNIIKKGRNEKYAFQLLQGDVQHLVDKDNEFKSNYFRKFFKSTCLFIGIISFNLFAAYAVNKHPFFENFSESSFQVGIYIVDIFIGQLGMFLIQKEKEKVQKSLKIDIKIKKNKQFFRVQPKKQAVFYENHFKNQVVYSENLIQQAIVKQKEIDSQLQRKQEQARLSALKYLDTKNRHEKNIQAIRGKLKISSNLLEEESMQRQSDLMILKSYHAFVAQEKAICIANRPLRALCDFGLDEFRHDELPVSNQLQLKMLSENLRNRFNILEIQLYGSYPVYLASLRLGIEIQNVRRPSDLDLRFEIETEDLSQIIMLIQNLFLIGFVLKNYAFPLTDIVNLQNYIFQKKMTGGHLNLCCVPSSVEEDAYEIDLTVIFKKYYRANYNPFNLLSHCLNIANNQVCFDANNVRLRKQLAQDILNVQFNIDVDALLNPEVYNVFNVFSRLLRNKKAWAPFYNMYLGNVNITLINLPLIINFFKLRFALCQQKACLLELVSIIIQNDFLLLESQLIIKGFLFALLQAINLEAKAYMAQEVFSLDEIDQDVNEITQKLQHVFSTFIPVVQGDSQYNKNILKKLYYCLIEILMHYKPQYDTQVFFCNAQQTKASILFNAYKTPRMVL